MPIKRADDRQRNVVHFVMKPGSAGRMPASRVKRSIAQPPRYQLSFINQSFCRIEGGKSRGFSLSHLITMSCLFLQLVWVKCNNEK
jgi:hypothetical protein